MAIFPTRPGPRPTPISTLINMNKFEKDKIKKNTPLAKNIWYYCSVNYFPKSVKMCVSDVKEKIMRLFNIKIEKS